MKPIKAWGGFVDDKLYVMPRNERPDEPTYDEPRYAVFPSRKAAKEAYVDVRRVWITEIVEP